MNNTTKNSMCVVATALVTVATSFAGTSNAPATTSESNYTLNINGSYGVDITSGHVYRGVLLDSNPVIQPYLAVNIPTGLENVMLKMSTLETFGTKSPLTGFARTENSIGLDIKTGQFTVSPSFQTVYSPASKYQSSEGINVTVKYDDSKLLGPFALNPHVSTFVTTNGTNGNGLGGQYREVGVEPSYEYLKTLFSVPVNVGFGKNNYYKNDVSHGYTSLGLAAERDLAPNVSLRVGVTYYDTSAAVNGKNTQWSTTAGVRVSF